MKYSIAYYDSDVKFSGKIFEDTLAIAFGYEGDVKKIMDTYRLQNPIYFGTYENLQDAQQAYWRAKEFDEENNELEIVELNGSEKWVFRDYYQESLNFLKGEGAIGIELLLVKIFRNLPLVPDGTYPLPFTMYNSLLGWNSKRGSINFRCCGKKFN